MHPFARISSHSIATLVAVSALSACGGGGGSSNDTGPVVQPPAPAARTVAIQFAAKAGTAPVACGTLLTAVGTSGISAQLRDLRFYVSEVALVDALGQSTPVQLDASEWQAGGVALIDLEDASGACVGTAATNARITGTVPAGNYVGMRMTIGVPGQANHSDYATAKAPLDIQAMAWSWQAGRKFMKIEVNPTGGVNRPGNPDATPPVPATTASTFNLHLGSTGCTGNPATGEIVACAASNRMAVHLAAFDPATQKVVLDLQQLFAGNLVTQDLGGPFGCMSGKTDPECPATFERLQIDMASGQPIDGGRQQTVFRAEAL
jgi:uncharacterized repeat protein (TIGR04052 family)